MEPADRIERQAGDPGRSPHELTALLLELGRMVKARRFYGPGDPELVRLFERGSRAWQAELARHGGVELAVGAEGFRSIPEGCVLHARQLSGLASELASRGVHGLRVAPDIDAEALAGLVEVLAGDPEAWTASGGAAAALRARVPAGIELEGGRGDSQALRPARPREAEPEGAARGTGGAPPTPPEPSPARADDAPVASATAPAGSGPEPAPPAEPPAELDASELLAALEASSASPLRAAIRRAGEAGLAAAAPRLATLLEHPEATVREEAARALGWLSEPVGVDALLAALGDASPEGAIALIRGLAVCGSARAVAPLALRAERALGAGRPDEAREAIRALGRLGRPEAVAPLAELLMRRGFWRRRRLRELKIAAAAALACVPGDEAALALTRAVGSRDAAIRRAAQLALERRAQAHAREQG